VELETAEMILYNLVFWTVWYHISMLPEKLMQHLIDTY
jgi:hypothetical protein